MHIHEHPGRAVGAPEKGQTMIVALHGAPKSFFGTEPPHSNDELLKLVRKTASLGFRAIEIGPLANYLPIEGRRLRTVLDELNLERSVHVGGLFDATKFALTEEEYRRAEQQLRLGVELSEEIGSTTVSVHPPYFAAGNNTHQELLSKARSRYLQLLKRQVELAHRDKVKVAIESFCYPPFIFKNINDFASFIHQFPPEKLGVLSDIGHLYQVGISLSQSVSMFKDRLVDLHIHDATLEKNYKKATHLPIGKGTIDFSNLITLLREAHYDRWLTLEIHGDEKEVLESKQHLETLLVKT
jgi:sugar phosphate isomerase/epimerase